jgi:hypothetical protein
LGNLLLDYPGSSVLENMMGRRKYNAKNYLLIPDLETVFVFKKRLSLRVRLGLG